MLEAILLCNTTYENNNCFPKETLILQSIHYNRGHRTLSELSHPSIKNLYMFFKLLLELLCKLGSNPSVQDDWIGSLIDGIEPLYLFSFTTQFQLSTMVARLYTARKVVSKSANEFADDNQFTDIKKILDEICFSLKLDQIYLHSKVVGKLRNESLKFKELYKIETALVKFESYFQRQFYSQLGKP